jgi:GDP-D-mannose dehydratase
VSVQRVICDGSRGRLLTNAIALSVVLSTNETHEIKEFIEKSFGHINVKLTWEGEGVNEVAKNSETGQVVVRIDEKCVSSGRFRRCHAGY